MPDAGGTVHTSAVAGLQDDRGFVLAATGSAYVQMALASAEGLRAAVPSVPIWLFCDNPPASAVFDRIVTLEMPWRRSKIDAMLATPFARTVYLDVDTFVAADISDLFVLLDRFDLALAHDQERNSPHGAASWRRPFPACFPQFNSGVIAYRRTPEVLDLLAAWREAVKREDHPRDQPALRELLWESGLRIATLPPEYNYMDRASMFGMSRTSLAPRIIHHPDIHRAAIAGAPPTLERLLGRSGAAAVGHMIAADRTLAAAAGRPPARIPSWRKLLLRAGILSRAVALRLTRKMSDGRET